MSKLRLGNVKRKLGNKRGEKMGKGEMKDVNTNKI